MDRVTVPLFNCDVADELAGPGGRHLLGDRVVLGWLNTAEGERVRSHYQHRGNPDAPLVRIEIFFDDGAGPELGLDHFRQQLGLLAVASAALPIWQSIPIDTHDSQFDVWVRKVTYHVQGGVLPPGYVDLEHLTTNAGEFSDFLWRHRIVYGAPTRWALDADSLNRWSAVQAVWPPPRREPRLDVALSYFTDALFDLCTRPARAIVTAMTAVEALFGGSSRGITDQIARRAAHLVSRGDEAIHVHQQVRAWYAARSKMVHEGKSADPMMAAQLFMFVRCVLPVFAHFIEIAGGHKEVLERLDEASFVRVPELEPFTSRRDQYWWDPVPLERLLNPADQWYS